MADIENFSVVPTGTVWVAGYMAKDSTPRGPEAPTLTLPAATLVLVRALAVLSADETWVFSFLESAYTDGMAWLLDTTLTVPFMPAWMVQ